MIFTVFEGYDQNSTARTRTCLDISPLVNRFLVKNSVQFPGPFRIVVIGRCFVTIFVFFVSVWWEYCVFLANEYVRQSVCVCVCVC